MQRQQSSKRTHESIALSEGCHQAAEGVLSRLVALEAQMLGRAGQIILLHTAQTCLCTGYWAKGSQDIMSLPGP